MKFKTLFSLSLFTILSSNSSLAGQSMADMTIKDAFELIAESSEVSICEAFVSSNKFRKGNVIQQSYANEKLEDSSVEEKESNRFFGLLPSKSKERLSSIRASFSMLDNKESSSCTFTYEKRSDNLVLDCGGETSKLLEYTYDNNQEIKNFIFVNEKYTTTVFPRETKCPEKVSFK